MVDGELKIRGQGIGDRGQKGGGNKRSGFEKRINREQVPCQRWGALKERRHPAWGSISLGILRDERVFEKRGWGGVNLSWG